MDHPDGPTPSPAALHHLSLPLPGGLTLECGVHLDPVTVAYRTDGTLAPARDNAILVRHALTGDQYVAEPHPITRKPARGTASSAPASPSTLCNSSWRDAKRAHSGKQGSIRCHGPTLKPPAS